MGCRFVMFEFRDKKMLQQIRFSMQIVRSGLSGCQRPRRTEGLPWHAETLEDSGALSPERRSRGPLDAVLGHVGNSRVNTLEERATGRRNLHSQR
jgi:hypothetical protein